MKRVYVNEQWCLGCHLCEYNCAYANSPKAGQGLYGMVDAVKDKPICPRITIESTDEDASCADPSQTAISYAVQCRHCTDPICVKSCISGALHKENGTVVIDHDKCVGCFTCILVCPYGAITHDDTGAVQKCELCLKNTAGKPACVAGCPNAAIVFEER